MLHSQRPHFLFHLTYVTFPFLNILIVLIYGGETSLTIHNPQLVFQKHTGLYFDNQIPVPAKTVSNSISRARSNEACGSIKRRKTMHIFPLSLSIIYITRVNGLILHYLPYPHSSQGTLLRKARMRGYC